MGAPPGAFHIVGVTADEVSGSVGVEKGLIVPLFEHDGEAREKLAIGSGAIRGHTRQGDDSAFQVAAACEREA